MSPLRPGLALVAIMAYDLDPPLEFPGPLELTQGDVRLLHGLDPAKQLSGHEEPPCGPDPGQLSVYNRMCRSA